MPIDDLTSFDIIEKLQDMMDKAEEIDIQEVL